MGLITGGENNIFKPASYVYSEVKRLLTSFDAANLLDEGEFPTYTKSVLKRLGIGAYMESQALIPIVNYKANLPNDFEYLYVAYKCSPFMPEFKGERKHQQPGGFAFTTEVNRTYTEDDGCSIDCCVESTNYTEGISVQHYVIEGKPETLQFGDICPLRLSPNVDRSLCIGDGQNFLYSSPYEITISNKKISTNFTDDYVYMKYYAFPLDEDGEILIPNNQHTEDAIKWYIIYQILLGAWFNSSIPDIQNKAAKAEELYNNAFAECKYYNKLGTFADSINQIRTRNGLNKMVYMTNQYTNTNFQRTR